MNAAGALARVIRAEPDRPGLETCDLCGVELASRHRHVVERGTEHILCACTACALLFERDGAALGHYRLVPEDRRRVGASDDDRASEVVLERFPVPVGLAFFVKSSVDGRVVGWYPSPMGPTKCDLDDIAWDAVATQFGDLEAMLPDVQALLVNRARGRQDCWIVPIDDCYRLVAIIRQEWRGLSGGPTVWPAVEQFFTALAAGQQLDR